MLEMILMGAMVAWPFAAALLGYLLGRRDKNARNWFVIVSLAAELVMSVVLFGSAAGGTHASLALTEMCGLGLSFTLEGFRAVFLVVAAFLWFMSGLLTVEYLRHDRNRNRFYLFLLLTLGATAGVFLSADLYTTFIFFEIMSFTSYVWVGQNETPEALEASYTYLAVAVVSGLILLMGLFLLWRLTGTLAIDELYEAGSAAFAEHPDMMYAAGGMILLGFGAKAGMFPLHIWMPKAHTVAPAPASVLLSGILTKAGLFGVLAICNTIFQSDPRWGMLVLSLGLVTMVLGAVLAVFAVNLKRTLACSSMSQIGFVLVGIGVSCLLSGDRELAARGIVLHMLNHSLFKLVLFLAAGVVFMNAEALELNDVRGFGRKKPLLQAVFLAGALGIGGIPLFSGYVSKTLLHESIVEFIGEAGAYAAFGRAAEILFLTSGGLTVAYMLKLYVALFHNRHPKRQKEFEEMPYANGMTRFALVGSAVLIPVFGLLPGLTMDRIAGLAGGFFGLDALHHTVVYFSWTNLKGAVISIAIGAAVYFLFIRQVIMVEEEPGCYAYVDRWPAWLDIEKRVYVPILMHFLSWLGTAVLRVADRALDVLLFAAKETIFRPLVPESEEHEDARIRRHRRFARVMSLHRSATVVLSFGLLMCFAGLAVMMIWMFVR